MIELAKYLPAFLHTAAALSFSQAARNMGVTPAAVSKAVRNLESALSVRLFHRSTHSLALTDDGERFYAQVAPIAQSLTDSFTSMHSLSQAPQGTLRVTAPVELGHDFVLPLIPSFHNSYPSIRLQLNLDDRPIDLVKEGFDVGIGNRAGKDSLLIAKKLFDIKIILVASPGFIANHNIPNNISSLGDLPCIGYQPGSRKNIAPWQLQDSSGQTHYFEPNTVITVNTVQALCELAALGVGIAPVATWAADKHIKAGRLIQVIPQVTTMLAPARIYYTSRENQPAKVRAFIDFITQHLKASS